MTVTWTDNVLRVGIAAMVVLATIMLGIGEESVVLVLITLVAVAASSYFTDLTKTFQLSQSVANGVALSVVLVSAANMLYVDRAGQIGAVASLQSYLQYVLLFQPKTARVYWQLALLSLGQVAIAATLVPGPVFGAMLLVYLLLGSGTFTLLMLRSDAARFESARLPAPTADPLRVTLTRPPRGRAPQLSGSVAAPSRGFGVGLIEQMAGMVLTTFAVAAVLFFFIPRRDVQNREVPTTEPLRSVGFSKTITLGELGEVVQNPDVVMRIEFFHGHSSRPFKLVDEPLLRGSVVTHYEEGEWSQPRHSTIVALSGDPAPPFVRQRITAEPMDVPELFCVVPVFAVQPDQRLRLDASFEQLLRHEDNRAERLEFEVGTNGIVNDRMRRYVPSKWQLRRRSRDQLLQPWVAEGRTDRLEGLRETAARVLAERNVSPNNRAASALALNDYLRNSGEFTYSLEGKARDPSLDPLVDFVTTNRAGHCEYFAGALVMMLRSQGIPARMAIGFKGGEWNAVGMYYQVQQLHAHAWVEVYLDQEDIPPGAFGEDEELPPAAWLVLDPTVSVGGDDGANRRVGWWAQLRQSIDYANVLWSTYVVGLNSKRQRQGIYEPIEVGARASFDNLFGREVWRARLRALESSHVGAFWQWYRRHWFSWRGGLVAVGASLTLVAGTLALRYAVARLKRWALPLVARGTAEPPTLEMYRRLETALARQGFQRSPSQTAHEFAVQAGGHLAESIELQRVSHLPRRVVESFYRVRFGGRALDNREAEAVEHALGELEAALGASR
ncbi:MAG: DUF3488 and DUF4129 domain-containing transglutaminase family protein [Pirellulales bacterium]